ncbi:MAG: FKBP-type peptidyl-prolyl cis-trans isomerase [bacterium]
MKFLKIQTLVFGILLLGMVCGCSSSKSTSSEPQIVTTASGLQYVDYFIGTGEMPKVTQTVVVNCTGRLKDSTIFWSTMDPKFGPVQPLVSPLTQLIKGWQEGITTMRVGGVRKLIIPYTMAYGEQGRPPTIPPKADLIFDITLLGIQ